MNLLIFNLKTDADDDVLGFTTDWINALARHCERVFVVSMMRGRIAVADNVQVYSVGKERGFSEARRVLEFYRLLARLLRRERIDACFAHMMPLFTVMGWPLLCRRRIPIVLWYAHRHIPLMLRIAVPLVERVLASSGSGFRLRTDKLRVIGQGIDVTRFRPAEHKRERRRDFVLLTVGRISPVKRLEILIDALAQLPETGADGRTLVARFVGNPLSGRDRRYAQVLRRRVQRLKLAQRVQFLPAAPFARIDGVYRDADVFVNSSDTGSVDKTVLEAMSCGLPVVTSNAAFSDIFTPVHAAQCRVAKDDPGALAQRLQTLIAMPADARHALGLALRDTVCREHSLEGLCQRLMVQLREVRRG